MFVGYAGFAEGFIDTGNAAKESPKPIVMVPKVAQKKKVGLGLSINFENLEILLIKQGGPCDKKGVQVGDRITAIDGNPLFGKSQVELVEALAGLEGNPATLTIIRGGQEYSVSIKREWTAKGMEERVKMGLKRRTFGDVKGVFESLYDKKRKGLTKEGLLCGLKQYAFIPDILEDDVEKVEEAFKKYDLNGDGTIDLDEFSQAVKDNCPNPEWVHAVPLMDMFVDCLPRQAGNDYVLEPQQWTDELVHASVNAFKGGLMTMMMDLKASWKKVDEDELRKDPKLSTGTISDFHKELTARIGPPQLQFKKAMEIEHCGDHDFAEYQFVTSNKNITTCPKKEWEIVMCARKANEDEMKDNREIPNIAELMKLAETKIAELIEAEVISVVIYSGPMYLIYNSILRRFGEIYDLCKATNHSFSTTIHVLTSAVYKISRVTQLKPNLIVYRGLGHNSGLPSSFFEPDSNGCSGITEWGFMSTSSKKDTAIKYSKAEEGLKTAKLLKLHVSSVDHGACIRTYSQYKDEVEYLYLPCSFLQKFGSMMIEKTENGFVTVIPVMVNSNLEVRTVEVLQNEMKRLHTAIFRHLITEVEVELKEIAKNLNASERLIRDPTAGERTVEGFLEQIKTDCISVLEKHKAERIERFTSTKFYRKLVTEMLDVPAMAVSKLREWLENEKSSFLRYRFPCPLRTAHRRRICFVERRHENLRRLSSHNADPDSRAKLQLSALKLCRLCGFLVTGVDEMNELKETPIMMAAAEGRPALVLRLLVEAQADVKAARPDGVTPLWLAAQFGHAHCIEILHELNAELGAASCNGATPLYIAAQNGHTRCLEVLIGLKADVHAEDSSGQNALYQATLNNETDCIAILEALMVKKNEPEQLVPEPLIKEEEAPQKRLIISSGDISDVDGFLALAQYAKTGADVLFIMNYPAYIDVGPRVAQANETTETMALNHRSEQMLKYLEEYGEIDIQNLDGDDLEDRYYAMRCPGLGFKYGADKILARDSSFEATIPNYKQILDARRASVVGDNCENQVMKQALTDVAFAIVHKIWSEQAAVGGTGKLLFGIGGVNTINPFSRKCIKNEVLLYSKFFGSPLRTIEPASGRVYLADGEEFKRFKFDQYSEVVLDFCGSYSFWVEGWDQRIRSFHERLRDKRLGVKAAFVMGGVLTECRPVTLPSIAGVLNRLSSATMNQLYNPTASGQLFSFLREFEVPTFVVTNNVVGDFRAMSASQDGLSEQEKAVKDSEGVRCFLEANKLNGSFLQQLASTYYSSPFKPAQKPFDFYAAYALSRFLSGSDGQQEVMKAEERRLYFGSAYGTTFVSRKENWDDAKAEYIEVVSKLDEKGVTRQARRKETAVIRDTDYQAPLCCRSLEFHLDVDSKRLLLCAARAAASADAEGAESAGSPVPGLTRSASARPWGRRPLVETRGAGSAKPLTWPRGR